jgi:hypothetical protein
MSHLRSDRKAIVNVERDELVAGAPPRAPVAAGEVGDGALHMLLPIVPDLRHGRATVSLPTTSVHIKVYFDNATHTSRRGQRGWCDAPNGNIKYVFVDGRDRDIVWCWLYLWHQATDKFEGKPFVDHLAYEPPEAELVEAMRHIVLVDF